MRLIWTLGNQDKSMVELVRAALKNTQIFQFYINFYLQ